MVLDGQKVCTNGWMEGHIPQTSSGDNNEVHLWPTVYCDLLVV